MPAPPINIDLGSGMNTQQTINDLMRVERIPLQRIQRQNQVHELRAQAWEQVRNRTRMLEDRTRLLYSFAGSFAIKSVVSSDPGAITGQAAPNVQEARQNIQVLQLASQHQVHTSPLPEGQMPAANFTIRIDGRETAFEFRGGTPQDLLDLLKQKGAGRFESTGVRVDGSRLVITLNSGTEGARGAFEFEDPDGLLARIGLVRSDENRVATRDVRFSRESVVPIEGLTPATFDTGNDGRRLELTAQGALRVNVDRGEATAVVFKFTVPEDEQTEASEPNANATSPASVPERRTRRTSATVGPDVTVRVGDVELRAENPQVEADLPIPAAEATPAPQAEASPAEGEGTGETEQAEPVTRFATGVLLRVNGALERRALACQLTEESGCRLELPAGEIQGLYVEGPAGVSISDMQLVSSAPALVAANETTPARDAILKINGIEVTRPTNENISDIMQGVSLNLNRTTTGPVEIRVEVRSDEIVKEISEWVQIYNDLVQFCREMSKSGEAGYQFRLPQDDENADPAANIGGEGQPGIFAGDSTIRQLLASLASTVSSSYPAGQRSSYRVLADVGISSGEPGQSWDSLQSRAGLLQLDETKLRAALGENPEGVRALFASDANEDSIPDSGVAIAMEGLLKPYNRSTPDGLIMARILNLKDLISRNNKEIADRELSLSRREQQLREQFGRMERAVRENREMGQYLQRNMPQGN